MLSVVTEVSRTISFSLSRQWCRHLFGVPPPMPVLPYYSLSFRNGGRRAVSMCISTGTGKRSQRKKKENTGELKEKTKENEKRRTRSEKEFEIKEQHFATSLVGGGHIPVMLGEVLQVFDRPRRPLRSFVDCTLGAAGHSSAIIQAHPELEHFVGLDVDPLAHETAQTLINKASTSDLQVCMLHNNFKHIKSILTQLDHQLFIHGVDGILMDLGVSSMQVSHAERGFSVVCDGPLDMRMDPKASLKADDILNFWPEDEVGRILREYGEESNWRQIQRKIVKARLHGGLHSTSELVNLVRSMSPMSKGRQGWVKTATRVFQALRIAVNDELNILEHALRACFECLSVGGRLAVISFHSLEDRIVKQTFLDIINVPGGDESEEAAGVVRMGTVHDEIEAWVRQRVSGTNGTILTKRPITPSEEEEKLNYRCRSAKLRVIQKMKMTR